MPAGQAEWQGTETSARFVGSGSRSASAPEGQTTTQAMQNLQPDSTSVGAMVPTQVRGPCGVSTLLISRQPMPRTSLQAIRQRRQSMHRL